VCCSHAAESRVLCVDYAGAWSVLGRVFRLAEPGEQLLRYGGIPDSAGGVSGSPVACARGHRARTARMVAGCGDDLLLRGVEPARGAARWAIQPRANRGPFGSVLDADLLRRVAHLAGRRFA